MLKPSIKTVIDLKSKSVKIYMTSHWKVVGALHSPNGITTHTKVPQGVVIVVLCTSPKAIAI